MADRERPQETGKTERGKPASFDPVSGEVHGSGSGAGANAGENEDYDDDVISGGGSDQVGGPRPRQDGLDRPIDPDEGI